MTSCSSTKNLGNIKRDGSSFEKAIIAKNVSAEYEYVRKVCSDCQLLGQYLVFEGIHLNAKNPKILSFLALKASQA